MLDIAKRFLSLNFINILLLFICRSMMVLIVVSILTTVSRIYLTLIIVILGRSSTRLTQMFKQLIACVTQLILLLWVLNNVLVR